MKRKPKTNKEETVRKDTVFAKLRRVLFNAVKSHVEMQESQWDENGRCYMLQTFGDRGIIATMQRKANNKGWIVFFAVSIFPKNNSIPFIRDLKVRLTINETPDGVRLLWFVNGKPQWRMETSQMASSYNFYFTGDILQEVMNQLRSIYKPEDFIPILKFMETPADEKFTMYGLHQNNMKMLSGGTNPRQILNKIYGKYGQDGLTKNAFGGLGNIRSFTKFAMAAEVVKYLRSFPPSFFDKIVINGCEKDNIRYIGLLPHYVVDFKYFIKYFNHSKIQQDFINSFNNYGLHEDVDCPTATFFMQDIWQFSRDAGYMFKQIKNRAVRQNILSFKGTVQETHDLIMLEHAKLDKEDKPIEYTDEMMKLDNQEVTDNIISVLPKSTFDLILWGSQQHHCLGRYADLALDADYIFAGFKNKTTGDWIGHVEMHRGMVWCENGEPGSYERRWSIYQLRGKYNSELNQEDGDAIRMFLKNVTDSWNEEYKGKRLSQSALG